MMGLEPLFNLFKKSSLPKIAFGASLLLFTAACEIPEDAVSDVFKPPATPDVPPAFDVEPLCYSQRFTQPEAKITEKVDLLFVIDTSGSLDEERGDIADGIDSFIDELPEDINLRIAVTVGHGSTSSYAGQLYQHRNEPVIFDTDLHSRSEIRSDLRYKMNRARGHGDSDGGEEGLYSLQEALTTNLQENKDLGFFREDAGLAVVFVADENDICARYPEGITPVFDSNLKEGPAFDRDCGAVTPESVFDLLKSVKGEMPMLLSGILYVDPATTPNYGENEVGYGYIETIEKGDGILIDLASGEFDQGLTEIGALVTQKIELVTEILLPDLDLDLETLEVFVDGLVSPFGFVEENKTVHLHEPGSPSSTVDVLYCEKPVDNGQDDSSDGDSGDGSDDDPNVDPRDKDGDGLDDETGEPLF